MSGRASAIGLPFGLSLVIWPLILMPDERCEQGRLNKSHHHNVGPPCQRYTKYAGLPVSLYALSLAIALTLLKGS